VAGGKASAKRGRWNLAHLTAVDDVDGARALFNVSRVRADYGLDSTAGLTFTDRAQGERRNTVLAADTRYVFGKLYFLRGQIGGSRTDDGVSVRNAPVWLAEFDRTGRAWGFNYRITGIGPDFESAAGYVPRTDVVDAHATNRVSFYGAPGRTLEQLTFFAGPSFLWSYGDFASRRPTESGLEMHGNASFRGGWRLEGRVERNTLHYAPGTFDGHTTSTPAGTRPYVPEEVPGAWELTVEASTPAFKAFDAEVELARATVPLFDEGSRGRETAASAGLNLRAGGSVRVAARVTLSRLTRIRDGTEFARALIPRLKIEYQPRRSLFVRAVAEYQAQRRDVLRDARTGLPLSIGGVPSARDDANRLRADLLLSFEPTPGTVAFLGYGAGLDNGDRFAFDALAREADGFFLKLAYRFRR